MNNITIEITNIPDNIMERMDFEENEIYIQICGKVYYNLNK